jgi:hypothetical protein
MPLRGSLPPGPSLAMGVPIFVKLWSFPLMESLKRDGVIAAGNGLLPLPMKPKGIFLHEIRQAGNCLNSFMI